MLDDNTRRSWDNFARTSPNLRFPNVSLNIVSPFNINSIGRIDLETFVSSKDKKRITLFRQSFHTDCYADIFEFIKQIKIRFLEEGNLIKDKFIFNSDNSINEPFEINTINNNEEK